MQKYPKYFKPADVFNDQLQSIGDMHKFCIDRGINPIGIPIFPVTELCPLQCPLELPLCATLGPTTPSTTVNSTASTVIDISSESESDVELA